MARKTIFVSDFSSKEIVDEKQSYQLFCPLAPGSGTSFLGVAAKNPAFRAPGSVRRE